MDILSSLLSQKTSTLSSSEKVIWFVKIMKWVQNPRRSELKAEKIESIYTARIKYLLLILNKNPDWKSNFVVSVSSILKNISSPAQFIGSSFNSAGFVQEFITRVQDKILPNLPLSENLETLVHQIFPNEDESIYVDFIDETVLNELLSLFSDEMPLFEKLRSHIHIASYILSVQLLNNIFNIQNELHIIEKSPEELPEFQLEGYLRSLNKQTNAALQINASTLLMKSEEKLNELYTSMQSQGVKIELVYLFQMQRRRIRRLEVLLNFLSAEKSNSVSLRLFISHLILDAYHQKSFKSFIAENLSLITERIVQTNSSIGEHYVTNTWDEFKKMFRSALGGGAVTSITVFIKQLLTKLSLTGFAKGVFDGLNYSSSFLLIYMLGFTLATKQPSATAPYIATALQKSTTDARRAIVALLRTQFIAVLGNLTLVFPICFLVSWLLWLSGNSFLTHAEAIKIFNSTNLLGPSTLFAVFTACLLFISSIIAGWFENWVTLNQIGKRIEHSEKIISMLGQKRTSRLAEFTATNANSLSANIVLGFLLGLTPQIIKFMGIPLEVRHVTLATGAFATSLPIIVQQSNLDLWNFANATLGILWIGLINISVSFILAFSLASLSSKVKMSSFYRLLKAGFRLILTKPWLLIVPEKTKAPK